MYAHYQRDIKVTVEGPHLHCNVDLRFKDTGTLWTFIQAYAAGQAAAERRGLLERNKREQFLCRLKDVFPGPPCTRCALTIACACLYPPLTRPLEVDDKFVTFTCGKASAVASRTPGLKVVNRYRI